MITKDLIKKVSKKVDKEINLDLFDHRDFGNVPDEPFDSFETFRLTGFCEPEDAIWGRDLQWNFYTGLEVGIRNTLKVLFENKELLTELIQSSETN